jgi:acyl carrier protein
LPTPEGGHQDGASCLVQSPAVLSWASRPGIDVSLPAQSLAESLPAETPAPGVDIERELAELMVRALNLDVSAAAIDPQAPLYGEGLGLDSIDILEVALEVSKRYGFQLRSNDEDNVRIFQSLRSLAAHVAQHRTA